MPNDGHVTQEEMVARLREAFTEEKAEDVFWQLAESTADPVRPRDRTGRRRLHPVLLLSILLVLLTGCLIIYVARFA